MQGSGQAGVKMVIAPDVSLRGPEGAVQSLEGTAVSYRSPLKWQKPKVSL